MPDDTPHIVPQHAALLVMDYQNAIVGRIADSDALVTRAAAAISIARDRGVAIGYVRVALDDADLAAVPATNKSFAQAAGSGSRFRNDAPETAIDERVAPIPGDIVVRKVRVGAFSTTDLADQLAARGIDTLILAGISTSGVVLSTVRDAADRDYRIFVLADGCADPDDEVHQLLTTRIFPRQTWVVTVADLPNLFASD
jgi:nicotinamidase-related amidase